MCQFASFVAYFCSLWYFFYMKIIFCGGGTLGHINPGLSIISYIRTQRDDIEYVWVARNSEDEINAIKNDNIKCYSITTGKLRRQLSIKNVFDIFNVIIGYNQSKKILKKEKPDLVFSKGGFASVPVVYAAKALDIKVITHESDITLGLATRLNLRVAKKILKGFPLTSEEEADSRFVYSGNPIRDDLLYFNSLNIEEYEHKLSMGLKDEYSDSVIITKSKIDNKFEKGKKFILILGGSLGSVPINNLIDNNLDILCQKYNIYHQRGKRDYSTRNYQDKDINRNNYISTMFIKNELGYLLKKADLVISRCGANTLAEEVYFRKNIIGIPLLTNASRGEQIQNCEYYQRFGLLDIYKNSMNIIDTIENSIDNENIKKRNKAYDIFFEKNEINNAKDKIYSIIKETLI